MLVKLEKYYRQNHIVNYLHAHKNYGTLPHMKYLKNIFATIGRQNKKIWIANILFVCTYILIQTPGHLWLMSISQGAQAKPFTGAMMPLAFVPDWKKSDYIDRRQSLNYSSVNQNDLIPLPRIENIKSDFNSNFTYITMFRGKYMDEDRTVGAGSHDGVDIRAPIGTPIFAIGNGKVVKVHDEPDNKYLTIEHRDVRYNGLVGKFYSSYLHVSAILVQEGDVVDK